MGVDQYTNNSAQERPIAECRETRVLERILSRHGCTPISVTYALFRALGVPAGEDFYSSDRGTSFNTGLLDEEIF